MEISYKLLLATLLLSFACGPSAQEVQEAKVALEQAEAKLEAKRKEDERLNKIFIANYKRISAKREEAAKCFKKWFFDLHVVCAAQDHPNINTRCITRMEHAYFLSGGRQGTRYRGEHGQAFTVPVKLDSIWVFAHRGWRDSEESCNESREILDNRPGTMANSECVCLQGPDTRTGFWPKDY